MYNDINITEEDIKLLDEMEVKEYDDVGIFYTKKIKYMPKSVRLPISTLAALRQCTKTAFGVYITICEKLRNHTNTVIITRREFINFLEVSDSSISKGIKELEDLGLIIEQPKNCFTIPIHTGCKGNIDKIIKKNTEREKELKRLNNEISAVKSINELTYKFKRKNES